jgi:hypothetical protein
MNKKILLAAVLVLGSAVSASAQIVLENFSSFESPQTLFFGDWSSSGDPFVGDPTPVATFSQGAGFYNLASVTNADSSFVEKSFVSSLNVNVDSLLTLSLRLLPDNTANSLTVFLLDANANTAFASFQANSFSSAFFQTQNLALTTDAAFDWGQVASFRISGNDPFAEGTLSVALNTLAYTPVPEPMIYGLVAAGALALLALVRCCRSCRTITAGTT